eukprot:gene31960-20082_t
MVHLTGAGGAARFHGSVARFAQQQRSSCRPDIEGGLRAGLLPRLPPCRASFRGAARAGARVIAAGGVALCAAPAA